MVAARRCSAPLSHLLLLVSAPGTQHQRRCPPLRMSASASTTTTTPPLMSIPPIRVLGAGTEEVNGIYVPQDPQRVPIGFQRTCDKMRWPPQATVRLRFWLFGCLMGRFGGGGLNWYRPLLD